MRSDPEESATGAVLLRQNGSTAEIIQYELMWVPLDLGNTLRPCFIHPSYLYLLLAPSNTQKTIIETLIDDSLIIRNTR